MIMLETEKLRQEIHWLNDKISSLHDEVFTLQSKCDNYKKMIEKINIDLHNEHQKKDY